MTPPQTKVKRPNEAYTFWFDLSDHPALAGTGDSIVTATVTPFPTGLTIGTPILRGSQVGVRISGGVNTQTYTMELTAQTAFGDTINQTDQLLITDQPLIPPLFMHGSELFGFYFDFKNHPVIQHADSLSSVDSVTVTPNTLGLGSASISGTRAIFGVTSPAATGSFTLECTCDTVHGDTIQAAGSLWVDNL